MYRSGSYRPAPAKNVGIMAKALVAPYDEGTKWQRSGTCRTWEAVHSSFQTGMRFVYWRLSCSWAGSFTRPRFRASDTPNCKTRSKSPTFELINLERHWVLLRAPFRLVLSQTLRYTHPETAVSSLTIDTLPSTFPSLSPSCLLEPVCCR